jgi:hypothetical protein
LARLLGSKPHCCTGGIGHIGIGVVLPSHPRLPVTLTRPSLLITPRRSGFATAISRLKSPLEELRRPAGDAMTARRPAERFERYPLAYGRLTTRDGTQLLYDRAYIPFVLKRPGCVPEPYAGPWPPDVVEEICFGDERERTRHAPPVRDPWTEPAGWYEGRWRNQPPRSKRAGR